MEPSVRMLCRRSASLISSTRMSLAIATNIFRTFSACSASLDRNVILSSLVRPSTISATCGPNSFSMSSSVRSVSSTTSCSSALTSVVVSIPRSARIVATPSGWAMKSSPETRFCPACDVSANAKARWISLRSARGLSLLMRRISASRPSAGGEESPGRNRRRPPRRSALTCSWLCTGHLLVEVYRSRAASPKTAQRRCSGRCSGRAGGSGVRRVGPQLLRAGPLAAVALGHQPPELLGLLVGEPPLLALVDELLEPRPARAGIGLGRPHVGRDLTDALLLLLDELLGERGVLLVLLLDGGGTAGRLQDGATCRAGAAGALAERLWAGRGLVVGRATLFRGNGVLLVVMWHARISPVAWCAVACGVRRKATRPRARVHLRRHPSRPPRPRAPSPASGPAGCGCRTPRGTPGGPGWAATWLPPASREPACPPRLRPPTGRRPGPGRPHVPWPVPRWSRRSAGRPRR